MKRKIFTALLTAAVMLLSACGPISENTKSDTKSEAEIVTKTETEAETQAPTENGQTYTQIIDNELKPELSKVTFTAECEGNIEDYVTIYDLYNVHALHSGVVGLIGSPIEINYDTSVIDGGTLKFYYNKDELRGTPQKNLKFMYYADPNYEVYKNSANDKQECVMTLNIKSPGVYLIVDIYQWNKAWGLSTSGYEYDLEGARAQYGSDWERECNTGDILEIADMEWANENAPYFHVSTAEQLAGVVAYVNTQTSNSSRSCYIYLNADIDLEGYEWAPIGWDDMPFEGEIHGQGHTISNMKITCGENGGFIGRGILCDIVTNLTIENAEINCDRYAGILGGQFHVDKCENVKVSGTVNGNSDCGAMIGYDAGCLYENCVARVTLNGEKVKYFSPTDQIKAETPIEEVFTLTVDENNRVTRTDIEGYDQDLTWYITRNDDPILERNAENELQLDNSIEILSVPGRYTVYLASFQNGAYIRVSNIVEYELE